MRRHRVPPQLTGVLALTALAAIALGFVAAPSPVAAAGGCPVPVDRNGNCPIEHHIPVPGTTRPSGPSGPGGADPGGPGPGNPDNGRRCEWHTYPDQARWRTVFPEAPPDAVFGEEHCFLNGLPIFGPYVPQWRAPNTGFGPAPPPAPAVVAADGLVDVRALLLRPDFATNPPDPAPSIIDIPTFVSVPNWQGAIHRENCLQGLCVELTADPALTFDPGEPGAATIDCEDGGTRYDRNGASPRDRAEIAGACAYAYQMRTGANGRPDAWTAELTVTWTVSWTGPGNSNGAFDPISLSSTFDRVVEEVPTVITDYSR